MTMENQLSPLSFWKFLLAVEGEGDTFFGVVAEIITKPDRGNDRVPEFFFELRIRVCCAILRRIPLPATNVSKHLAHAYDNLTQAQFLFAPNCPALS